MTSTNKVSKYSKSGKSETCPTVVGVPGHSNAAGISYSTTHCQEQVYKDALCDTVCCTYPSIGKTYTSFTFHLEDQPETINSMEDLDQCGRTCEGVKVYPLGAGIVTPKWKKDEQDEHW